MKNIPKVAGTSDKNLKYILNGWITRGIKEARGREQGAQSSEHRAQSSEHRAQALQALQAGAFFGIRSFSEGFSEGLAQGKKAVGGEQGA